MGEDWDRRQREPICHVLPSMVLLSALYTDYMPAKHDNQFYPERSEELLTALCFLADRIDEVHRDIELLARALNGRLDELDNQISCYRFCCRSSSSASFSLDDDEVS